MNIFQTGDWDNNATSEKVCLEFFQSETISKKKPNKTKNKTIKSTIDENKESLKNSKIKKLNKRKKLFKNVENENQFEASSLNGNKRGKSKSKLEKKKINPTEVNDEQTKKSLKANPHLKNKFEKNVHNKTTKQPGKNLNNNVENSGKIKRTNNTTFEENPGETVISQQEIKGENNQIKMQLVECKIPSKYKKYKYKSLPLRERMLNRLKAARFRYLNEQIYSVNSREAQKIFKDDPEAFQAYHEGYRQQVNVWPLNPLDVIITSIQKMPKNSIIADFGCGEAKLAETIQQKVHSFDLVAVNDSVTACDMANVPLENNCVDVVVFCLSLMGTNLDDYLLEANRVLKIGGILKIAEIESRFEDINDFIEAIQQFRFKNTWKDLNHSLFYFLDFKKVSNVKNKNKLPIVNLNPCLYKKR